MVDTAAYVDCVAKILQVEGWIYSGDSNSTHKKALKLYYQHPIVGTSTLDYIRRWAIAESSLLSGDHHGGLNALHKSVIHEEYEISNLAFLVKRYLTDLKKALDSSVESAPVVTLNDNCFVGDLDKPWTGQVKFLGSKNINGYYGKAVLLIFQTIDGRIIKSFRKNPLLLSLWNNQQVKLSCVVSKHQHYKGLAETIVRDVEIAPIAPYSS